MSRTQPVVSVCCAFLFATAFLACSGGSLGPDAGATGGQDAASGGSTSGGASGASGGRGGTPGAAGNGQASGGRAGTGGRAGGGGNGGAAACSAGDACSAGFSCQSPCRINNRNGTMACFCSPNSVLACENCVPDPFPACAGTVMGGDVCMPNTDDTCCQTGTTTQCTCNFNGGMGNATWRCQMNAIACP